MAASDCIADWLIFTQGVLGSSKLASCWGKDGCVVVASDCIADWLIFKQGVLGSSKLVSCWGKDGCMVASDCIAD